MIICINRNILPILCSALVLLATGCTKTNIDEIPSYLAIDTISVNVTPIQGTASQKISDTWVYADNNLIGGYELPAKFPVLKSGSTDLSIFAGIKLNGINELRVPYPFYEKINKTIILEREKVESLGHLKFSYATGTKFAWLEDFEDSNLSIDTTARSEVNLSRVQLQSELHTAFPFETNIYAARVTIPNDSMVFECVSHDSFKLPVDGSSVFMEMNYKSNNPFTVGLLVNGIVTSQRAVLVINPSSAWNKIYINFTPTLSSNTTATNFRIFLTAIKNTDDSKAEIFFDNIKLLHF
jgi:hypothetical protein